MFVFAFILYAVAISFIANSYVFVQQAPQSLFFLIPIFLFVNIFAGCFLLKTKRKSLKICCHGTVLLVSFYISVIVSIIYQIIIAIKTIPDNYMLFVWSLIFCICVNLVIFWNGIICVYLTSTQLGIKTYFASSMLNLRKNDNLRDAAGAVRADIDNYHTMKKGAF